MVEFDLDFDPTRWAFTGGSIPDYQGLVFALGRYGDVFGPLPCELFSDDAWTGNMFCASHDLIGYQPFDGHRQDAVGFDQQFANNEARVRLAAEVSDA